MPDLATRTDHETEVLLLILLYLQDLELSLRDGLTPNWLNWSAQLGGELTPLLAATYMEAAEQLVGEHDGRLRDASDRARQWASGRASWIAGGMAATTRDAAVAGIPDDWHFSEARAQSVAITETTEAVSQGEHYGAAELAALAILLIPVWVTEEDDLVCPICNPLNRERQNVWQGLFPTGPPGHVNCRCHLQWVRV